MGEADDRRLSHIIDLTDGDETTLNEIEALAWVTLQEDDLSCLVLTANNIAIEKLKLIVRQRCPLGLGADASAKAGHHNLLFWLILAHLHLAKRVTSTLHFQ
jgi:hypothetical protein